MFLLDTAETIINGVTVKPARDGWLTVKRSFFAFCLAGMAVTWGKYVWLILLLLCFFPVFFHVSLLSISPSLFSVCFCQVFDVAGSSVWPLKLRREKRLIAFKKYLYTYKSAFSPWTPMQKQFLKVYFPCLATLHVILPNFWRLRLSVYFSIHFLPVHFNHFHCSFSFAYNSFQVWCCAVCMRWKKKAWETLMFLKFDISKNSCAIIFLIPLTEYSKM